MKKLSLIALALTTLFSTTMAQKPASPPKTSEGKIGAATVKVAYSSPAARGRKIMGELVPYNGQVWRTGANEATTISFDKAVKIEGKDLAAGKYALFTIPAEKQWVVIFNKVTDQMGAFDYKKEEDVLRVNVVPTKTAAPVESFTIEVRKDDVQMSWENTAVAFKIKG